MHVNLVPTCFHQSHRDFFLASENIFFLMEGIGESLRGKKVGLALSFSLSFALMVLPSDRPREREKERERERESNGSASMVSPDSPRNIERTAQGWKKKMGRPTDGRAQNAITDGHAQSIRAFGYSHLNSHKVGQTLPYTTTTTDASLSSNHDTKCKFNT